MSFLRWAGSKKQLAGVLTDFWHAIQCAGGNGRYIEAFCGSASLFFKIRPESAVLIDINRNLINCFNAVKTNPADISRLLDSYPADEKFYYQLRSQDVRELSNLEQSARFIYLNRYCFNGLYRTNSQGAFNVPFGGQRNGTLPSLEILQEAASILATTTLIHGDFFSSICPIVEPGDFIYLDPPYAKRNHSLDLQYGPDVFGVDDLKRLHDLLVSIQEKRAYFVFSYVECEEIDSFISRWGYHRVEVKRTIAASTTKRSKATEVLISNL